MATVWFAAFYSEARIGRAVWGLTGLLGALLLLNQFSASGLILLPGGQLSTFPLPWGETIVRIRGTFNPWGYAYYSAFILVAVYCLAAGRRVMQAGRKRRGAALGTGATIMAIAMASDILMEEQVWELLYWSDYAFLPLVFMMNAALVAELVGSHDRLRRLTDATFEGIFFTQDQRIVDANAQTSRMFALERADLIGRLPTDLLPPEVRTSVAQWVYSNTDGTLETLGLRGDGSVFPIEFRSRVLLLDGRPTYVIAVRDITERKAALAALKASEERYAKVFRNSPDAILITRLDSGLIVETNDRFTNLFGYPHDQVIGRTTLELQLWANLADRTTTVEQMRAQGFVRDLELELRRRDGELRTAQFSSELIELQGEPCMITVIRDITARKRAELALRASEERFDLAVRGSSDGIWDWDIKANSVYYSPRFRELLGFNAEEFPNVLGSLNARLHPDDTARTHAAIRAHLETRAPYDTEFRVQCRDGAYRWFRTRGQAVWDEAGQPLRMAGSISDIHEHRQAEEALRRSEAEFRAIFEGSAIGIALVGSDRHLLAVNPALCRFLGLSHDELLASSYGDKTHPDDRPAHLALYRDLLGGKIGFVQDEKRYLHEDGRVLWGRRTMSVVRHGDGRPRCVIGMVEDISERKHAEESLQLAQQRESQAHAEFARRLLAAQEQERKRLATELHDSLGQHLSLIKNRTTLALEQPALPTVAAHHLDNVALVITEAIQEVRNLAHRLRPVHIEQFGLNSSLESLLDQFADSTPIGLDRRLEKVDDLLKGEEATHVYRIVQECLNNLTKHSQAAQARVILERDLHCVRLRVEDDGCGFDPVALNPGENGRSGLGLTSIRERVAMMGGTVDLQSSRAGGTRIRIELPMAEVPAT